jgi:hypothetical protein
MRMGEHKAGNLFALAHEGRDIRQYDINTRLTGAAELDAEVHYQPLPMPILSLAIGVTVHADLACTANRQQNEIA